jgi:tetratricopeptide (TPR) repeat protein
MLLLGIPALLALGLAARAVVGPDPATGLRLNHFIERLEAGRAEEALAGFEALLARHPERPEIWLRAGRALRELGRPAEAAERFRRAADLDPDSETARFEMARAWVEAGVPDSAAAAAEEALAVDPDHAGALYIRAAVAASRGQVEEATHALARALDYDLPSPDRFRSDPRFDAVRNDALFREEIVARCVPGTFLGE